VYPSSKYSVTVTNKAPSDGCVNSRVRLIDGSLWWVRSRVAIARPPNNLLDNAGRLRMALITIRPLPGERGGGEAHQPEEDGRYA
jgi:hypothetical protein